MKIRSKNIKIHYPDSLTRSYCLKRIKKEFGKFDFIDSVFIEKRIDDEVWVSFYLNLKIKNKKNLITLGYTSTDELTAFQGAVSLSVFQMERILNS